MDEKGEEDMGRDRMCVKLIISNFFKKKPQQSLCV
jgi:hypothetical protein